MNWSYFKPNLLGKPEEDPEAHLLKIVDWMDTNNFNANQRVRFPLTLEGEGRLQYQSIHPFQCNWGELQNSVSKIDNTRE